MPELELQVIDLIVAETGTKRALVHLSATLAEDIGMDGDDAVEFFQKFHERFNVDLTSLYNHWDSHFYPEGWSGPPPFGCMVVIVVSVLAGDLVHTGFHRIPEEASCLAFVLLLGWAYGKIWAKHFNDMPEPKIPITVQTLIDAAASGKWPLAYEPNDSRFQTLP